MKNKTILYWLAALRLPQVGPVTINRWLKVIGPIDALFTANQADLQRAGATLPQILAIHQINWNLVEKDLAWCEEQACHIITWDSNQYPKLLKETVGAPLVLFVQGKVELLSTPQIAIVGSRHPTQIGQQLAEQFAFHLAKVGFTITSGLALGVDAAGHRGAIAAGGKTLAVLGNGLSRIYPAVHMALSKQILQSNGAVLTEFMPTEPPKAAYFPRRNRIISGLCLGVLVIEAALKSGSLITARYAIEQGRDVFAVPGSIHNPLARGCHYLIKQGAKLVETAQDIIEEWLLSHADFLSSNDIIPPHKSHLDDKTPMIQGNIDPSCAKLLACLGGESTPLDIIVLRSGLTTAEVSSMLLTLELDGLICRVPGGYALNPKNINKVTYV